MSEILGEDAVYQGAPSFAYMVDDYTISRDGALICPEGAVRAEVEQLTAALREQGYFPVPAAEDSNGFTVEIPRGGFSEKAYGNLQKIIASKASLLKRALGTDRLDVETTPDTLRFPWFTLHGLEGETDAYIALITMAKTQKRVVARERDSTNDKFTMRLFLIRLGFIGDTYKNARKILLRSLTGNSSWKSGHPPERTAVGNERSTPHDK